MGEPGQPLPPCPHCRAAHSEELLVCPTTGRVLPLDGRMLDHRFRFIRKLGEGGMSTVWMAENIRVRKRVAIKIMHPEYARNPRTLARFQNEATAAGRIGNPHICDILDFGESPLGPYMVMEMLQGQSFAELLDSQGRIEPPLAVLIICEALKGLTAAHAAGIIHRDLKPENVFLHEPEPGRMLVKLMDFGISKFTEDPGGGKTGANVVMGTPEYMSPEQAAGAANVDARTDIWAMGVMLYRAIAGIEPFRGKTMAALLLALSADDHEPLGKHAPNLPPGLIGVDDRCLAKEPKYRYATADELLAALTPFQQSVAEGERPQAPVRTGKTMGFQGDLGMLLGPPPSHPTQQPQPTQQPPPQQQFQPQPHHSVGTVDIPRATVNPAPPGPPEVVRNRAQGDVHHPSIGPITRPLPPGPLPPGGPKQTWSAELNPNLVGSDQSWSMGRQGNFNDNDQRPRHETGGGRAWIGWVIGLGVVALLGGGVAVAWSMGAFDSGKPKVANEAVDGGTEAGDTAQTTANPDLPSGETGAAVAATTTGTEPTSTTGEPDTTGGTADTSGGGTSGGGTSGGGTSGGGTSGGTTGGDSGGSTGGDSGGSTTGGDSGGDSGGDGDEPDKPDPKFEPNALAKVGSLYTPLSHGPNGTWESAKKYCSGLKRKKKYGLKGWRMATVAELKSFQGSPVTRTRYWSSATDGTVATAVNVLDGTTSELEIGKPSPRAFCVSKR